MRSIIRWAAGGLALSILVSPAAAAEKKVVVAYQTGAAPYIAGIASGDLAKAAGWTIEFKRFNSGADIFAAIASGDVQIGDVGSSPFAAAVSRGLDVKAVYITGGAGEDEALVVRKEIKSTADLRGKKLAAAPVSTDHYQLLAVLQQEGIKEAETQVIAIPQPEIVAAWKRGDIDGAFVWDPALAELRKDGHLLLTAKEVAERGAPTFGALVVRSGFAKDNPEFVSRYVALLDGYYRSLRDNPSEWGAKSENAALISKLQGGTPEENAGRLTQTVTIPLETQLTEAWLGGGDKSGVAKILASTAEFLKSQKKITTVRDTYADAVAPELASGALKLTN
jgi:taurine transport system substrate-binding protein